VAWLQLASRSRVMPSVTTAPWQHAADEARDQLSRYASIELLLQIGEYKSGSDARADRAVHCREKLQRFLRQDSSDSTGAVDMLEQLQAAVNP